MERRDHPTTRALPQWSLRDLLGTLPPSSGGRPEGEDTELSRRTCDACSFANIVRPTTVRSVGRQRPELPLPLPPSLAERTHMAPDAHHLHPCRRAVARLPLHCSFSFGVSLSEEEVDVSNTQTAEVNAEKSLSRVLP
ncbi:hypothetical protein GW17_00059980 [Ensete ventricosum]|nr:hypothetical protein GW17_00059980 [Ensete ventricosum]